MWTEDWNGIQSFSRLSIRNEILMSDGIRHNISPWARFLLYLGIVYGVFILKKQQPWDAFDNRLADGRTLAFHLTPLKESKQCQGETEIVNLHHCVAFLNKSTRTQSESVEFYKGSACSLPPGKTNNKKPLFQQTDQKVIVKVPDSFNQIQQQLCFLYFQSPLPMSFWKCCSIQSEWLHPQNIVQKSKLGEGKLPWKWHQPQVGWLDGGVDVACSSNFQRLTQCLLRFCDKQEVVTNGQFNNHIFVQPLV